MLCLRVMEQGDGQIPDPFSFVCADLDDLGAGVDQADDFADEAGIQQWGVFLLGHVGDVVITRR
jgi:hypothetical protein